MLVFEQTCFLLHHMAPNSNTMNNDELSMVNLYRPVLDRAFGRAYLRYHFAFDFLIVARLMLSGNNVVRFNNLSVGVFIW